MYLRTTRSTVISAIVAASLLACGGSTHGESGGSGGDSSGGSGGATGGTGGAGGSGGATGGSGGGGQASCQDISGTTTLESADIYGEPPWVWIHETTDFGCSAVVASKRFPGRRYEVALSATKAVLTPIGEPAIGGYLGMTDHHLTRWNEISLDIVDGHLGGTGRADVIIDWNEEDIWGEDPATLDLTLADVENGTLEMAGSMLPWRGEVVLASRPTSGIATHIQASSGWSANDLTDADAEGVIESRLHFSGPWDEVRGQTLSFPVLSSLVDVSGAALAATALSVGVYDVGPALATHDMFDTGGLATWGSVQPYTEGSCGTSGCAIVRGHCGNYGGIAGQLLADGATEVVLSMQLEIDDDYVNVPAMSRVEVRAEDGTFIVPTTGGTWDETQAEQVWVYDVTGHTVLGFSIESASYCHGWGGPIIVDSVVAQ